MKRLIFSLLACLTMITACTQPSPPSTEPAVLPATRAMGMGMGQGMAIGAQSGMMARHHAAIPDEYSDLTSPIAANQASWERGAEIFITHCATCHGDGAMGDGPSSASHDPAPAPIARTSQMMGDSYLFWRISEGGTLAPFNSAMPSWKEVLDEDDRWHVINYVRALGSGAVTPQPSMGGSTYDPNIQATVQASNLAAAVEQGVITPEEAADFGIVHAAVEAARLERGGNPGNNETTIQAEILNSLVLAGTITQSQADSFSVAHDRLMEAGLMK